MARNRASYSARYSLRIFFFQAEDGIRDLTVTGVQTCALPISVGMAMGLVGVCGFSYLVGWGPAFKNVGHTTMRTVTDYNFAVIPLFLLMGSFEIGRASCRERV